MKGYPAGTKCVITWPKGSTPIGQIVTTGSRIWPPGHSTSRGIDLTLVKQEVVEGVPSKYGGIPSHPIEWMRPIDEDTDADDEEIIKRLSAPKAESLQTEESG